MKTKLLIATDGLLPRWDGIASFLNHIIPRISEHYNTTVIGPNLGPMKVNYNVNLIRFNTLNIRLGDNYYPSLINFKILSKQIKKSDVVFVQCFGTIGLWATLLAKYHKKPVIIYSHMLEWKVYAESQKHDFLKVPINISAHFLAKILYNLCDVILVASAEQSELFNFMAKKVKKRVVHLGVNTKLFKPAASNVLAKHELGIDQTKFVVGYAGRVSYEKDLKTLYRAFLRLESKYDDVVLLIAGGGHPSIEKMFKNKENVILTGLQDNLAIYYQAMDVYVLPSLVETTSLTTMEAMACGTPVIVTPVGFIKEYINNGSNGLIFPKKNSYTLYNKIIFLKDNPEARERLGRKGRETIINNYTWDLTAENLIKIIDELIPNTFQE